MIGYYHSPLGVISYTYDKHTIFGMSFTQEDNHFALKSDAINDALDLYFSGQLTDFPFEFSFEGYTPFQVSVFHALLNIPYGQTRSYKDIAQFIGKPKAYRAVGQACKRNPIGIMVPCHRVIGSDQSLTGYSGKDFIELKKALLDLEKKFVHL